MTHLSPDELLALVESAGGQDHPHLRECARCRAEADEARAALAAIRSNEVPEPSPLFWEHLSARISERLGEDPETPARAWPGWRVLVPSVIGIAAVVLAVWMERDMSRRPPSPVPAPAATLSASLEATVGRVGDDESWSMLAQLAGGLDVDTLSDSLGTSEAMSAERAVDQMSAEERARLADLLQAQLGQAASHE